MSSPHNPGYQWFEDPGFQDWLNELMANAGPEWDIDEAMTSIAVKYVRHLEDNQYVETWDLDGV
jgi:hypothetical protein